MAIQELTGSQFPLIQAPMAGVQDSELAIAVAKSGGIGSIACAMLSADAIEREVNRFRGQAQTSLNLNFTCPSVPKANPEVECE